MVDSGFWLALASRNDRYHPRARQALGEFSTLLFITTWPVIVESSYLIFQRAGFSAQMLFLENIKEGGMDVFHLDDDSHWPRLIELMRQYRNLPMDLADASLVLLAEELGHGRILSTDQRDFNTYRWKNHKPFRNLLLPE